MIRFALALLALSTTVPALTTVDTPAISHGDDAEWCLRCHGMETLGVRQQDGSIRSLAVDSTAFSHSNHRNLTCVDCHADDATRFPHGPEAAMATTCAECHTKADHPLNRTDPLASMHFAEIESEFMGSVHRKRVGDEFTCFSCHNPHQFRKSEDPSLQTIEAQNRICLDCHGSADRFSSLTDRDLPNLAVSHAWLPKRSLHWQHVRCLDCHTSYEPPNRSHLILAKESAVRKCEDCHSQNSVLLDKLYRHRVVEERAEAGFLNAVILNDSYVIGATRNGFLDLAGIVIIGGAIFGVTVHGVARRIGRKKRRD